MNPVVSDVRCARPAGKLFVHKGQLFRPAQDGSRGYGGSVAIRRVDSLTTASYAESPVNRIDPDWDDDLVGTHTLNRDGNTSVVDVLRRARRIRWRRASALFRRNRSVSS